MNTQAGGCTFKRTLKGSGEGSHLWLKQRLSAIGLLLLSVWLLIFLINLIGKSTVDIITCFKNPYQITCFGLFIIFSFYHAWLGVVEVIEDYIHCNYSKGVLKIVILFSFLFLVGLGMLSLIKLFIA